MPTGRNISAVTKKLVFQEANSTCPFCGEKDINTLQIHHIKSWADGGENEPGNLIPICANCHTKVTNKAIAETEILRMKLNLVSKKEHNKNDNRLANMIQLDSSTNMGVIANTLNITSQRNSSVKVQPPQGTIASERDKRNYIKYLIDRYNQFKKSDRSIGDFKYAIIYRAIQREFKCKWDFVPIERFEALASYIQKRIDATIVGKAKKKQDLKTYSSFEEFLSKQQV